MRPFSVVTFHNLSGAPDTPADPLVPKVTVLPMFPGSFMLAAHGPPLCHVNTNGHTCSLVQGPPLGCRNPLCLEWKIPVPGNPGSATDGCCHVNAPTSSALVRTSPRWGRSYSHCSLADLAYFHSLVWSPSFPYPHPTRLSFLLFFWKHCLLNHFYRNRNLKVYF